MKMAASRWRPALPRSTIECAADRLKIFRGENEECLEEYSMYHRKDGLLVKEGDDIISAVRYAVMMRRHGQTDRRQGVIQPRNQLPKQWNYA